MATRRKHIVISEGPGEPLPWGKILIGGGLLVLFVTMIRRSPHAIPRW